MKQKIYPSQRCLFSLFNYNRETGEFTSLKTGKRAGSLKRTEGGLYRSIEIDGSAYYEHILAWIFIYGVQPVNRIDHKDRCGIHNWINNLRVAPSESHNKANRSKRHAGVYERSGRYTACVGRKGSIIWLGMFDTVEEARQAQQQKSVELYGEFARVD